LAYYIAPAVLDFFFSHMFVTLHYIPMAVIQMAAYE